ncbi:MAG TPA: TetR/AcrR family transcriptional regulator [Polyangiaceae bacterium]
MRSNIRQNVEQGHSHSAPAPVALPPRLKPRKLPGQERSQQTVDAIVTAAAHILAHEGVEALTTNAVAERAGASIGSVYQYFPHKQAIVAAVLERHSESEARFFMERMQALEGKDLRARVRGLLTIPLEFRRQHSALQLALLEQMPTLGRYFDLRERVRCAAMPLRALLEAHAGEIRRTNLDLACHVLVNAIQSLTHDGILPRPEALSDEALLDELTHLVVGYLLDSDQAHDPLTQAG